MSDAYEITIFHRHIDKSVSFILASENRQNFKKQSRVKVDAHAYGVGFCSLMTARCLPIP